MPRKVLNSYQLADLPSNKYVFNVLKRIYYVFMKFFIVEVYCCEKVVIEILD